MLPLRMKLPQDRTCTALLEDLRDVCLQAYEHRAVPFDYLLQVLDVPRKTSHNPIFQVVVNYQSQGAFPKPDFGDFQFVEYDHYNARTQTDISLEVEESADGSMQFHFDFDAAIYGTEVAEKFAQMYLLLAAQVIEGAGKSLDQLELASPRDLQMTSQLLQPQMPNGKSIGWMRENLFSDLFRRWVAANPNKEALVDGQTTTSYKDMDKLTRCTAESLLNSDVPAQQCIGVCCEPSTEMMVAVYGILRARCIVVPIDPDFPLDRIVSIAEDTGLSTVIVNEASKAVKQKLISAGIVDLREVQKLTVPTKAHKTVELESTRPGDILCALFTSGSTGRSVIPLLVLMFKKLTVTFAWLKTERRIHWTRATSLPGRTIPRNSRNKHE
jgi:non-ribosomal peptide synthetase component F